MTTRRLALIALSFTVLVQTGMVLAYSRIVGACLCQVTGTRFSPDPPAYLVRFIEVAAFPASEFSFVGHFGLPEWWYVRFPLLGDWTLMLAGTAVNAVFWFAGAFALFVAVSRLGRVHR